MLREVCVFSCQRDLALMCDDAWFIMPIDSG